MSNVFISGRPNPFRLEKLGVEIAAKTRDVAKLRQAQFQWERRFEERKVLVLKELISDSEFAKRFTNSESRKVMMEAAVQCDPECHQSQVQVDNTTALLLAAEEELDALKAERRGLETSLYFEQADAKKPLEELNNEIYGQKE